MPNVSLQLLGLRSGGYNSRWLLDTYTWYILPMANPDGYEYSWDHVSLIMHREPEIIIFLLASCTLLLG